MSYSPSLSRMIAWELRLCVAVNRVSYRPAGHWLFATISRLGDGVFWYTLILVLPLLYGAGELRSMVHLLTVGLFSVALYKGLKTGITRLRPYQVEERIRRGSAPLDQYSFPSGHTLHAVAFSIVAVGYHPMLVWLVGPFTGLVALSRVVLGLHYPSDVLAGAVIGASVATVTLPLVGGFV
ncbi:undecaprenyl-diphosphatase [Gammaproteobacteria bacterium]